MSLETVSRYYDKLFGSIFETRELGMVRVWTEQKIAAIAGEKRDNGQEIQSRSSVGEEKRRKMRRGAGDTQIIADFHDVPGQSSVIRALLAGVLAGVKFNLSRPK